MADDPYYLLAPLPMEQLQACRQQDINTHGTELYGVPLYYARWPEGGIETYPLFRVDEGRLDIRGDQVFYVPTPKAEPYKSLTEAARQASREFRKGLLVAPPKVMPSVWVKVFDEASRGIDAAQRKEHPAQMPDAVVDELLNDQNVPCNICGQRGLHACVSPTPPTIFNRIVSMVEFKGRLWVATTKGVFVKRENEDAFDQVELYTATAAMGGLTGKGSFNIPTERAADEAAGLVPLHPRQTAERTDPFVPNKFGEHG